MRNLTRPYLDFRRMTKNCFPQLREKSTSGWTFVSRPSSVLGSNDGPIWVYFVEILGGPQAVPSGYPLYVKSF